MRPNRVRRLLCTALLLAPLAMAAGCVNPFKPADPQLPSGDIVPENFGTPEEVLETMRVGIVSRSVNGGDAYLHAFAESTALGDRAFRAFYDPAVKATWQSVNQLTAPEPWDLALERNLPQKLDDIRPTSPEYIFQWAQDPDFPLDPPITGDTAQIHRKYTLFARISGGEDIEIIGIGFADLSLQKERSGRWSIFRWQDRVDPAVGVNPAETDQRTFSWWRLESLTR